MKRQSLNRAGLTRRSMLQTVGFNFYDVFVYAFCILFALICVYPMWYVLICSITPYEEYIKGGLMLWPTGGVDLQYYQAIFNTKAFTTSMWISVSKTVLATVLSLLVTSTMAYACSKAHIRGMKLVNALVVFNLFFTGGLIPQYIRFHDLRHSAGTNMHELTGDFLTVATILGHSLKNMGISLGVTGNLDITTRHYVEVRNTRKAEVLKTYHKAVMNSFVI